MGWYDDNKTDVTKRSLQKPVRLRGMSTWNEAQERRLIKTCKDLRAPGR